jgi:ribosomal protein L30E
MARKKQVGDEIARIKKALDEKILILGSDRVISELKRGRIEEAFITSNCATSTKEDILHYAKLQKATVLELEISNEELGVLCKKPFSIAVAGISKK